MALNSCGQTYKGSTILGEKYAKEELKKALADTNYRNFSKQKVVKIENKKLLLQLLRQFYLRYMEKN